MFKITSRPSDDESWEFGFGDTVKAEERKLNDGNELVAVKKL